ncbi:MAG TPA: hypothetical protein VHO26_02810 [Propionibacteriaceae bacterium]|nr:hypothetical protein [Propionibacteriaceae bacterium]
MDRATSPALTRAVGDAVAAGLGRARREDAVEGRSGGPRGNAHLTAWTGLVLFVLFAAEGITLLSVRGLLSWHVAIGAILIPVALLKTASTGWRIVRYYTGKATYVTAGPPPLLLRLLGPLVIIATLAVLGSGVMLIVVGPTSQGGIWLGLHKASFIVWFAVTAAHVLTRLLPALLTVRDARADVRVPGWLGRGFALVASVAVGVVLALVLVRADGAWASLAGHDGEHDRPVSSSTSTGH